MPSSQVELTIEIYTEEGWTPVIAWDNFARAILKNFIDAGIFQDEANPGLENQTDTCIILTSSAEDAATFEVVEGYSSPCLKNKDTRFAVDT